MSEARRMLAESWREAAEAWRRVGDDEAGGKVRDHFYANAKACDARAEWIERPWWRRVFGSRPTCQ